MVSWDFGVSKSCCAKIATSGVLFEEWSVCSRLKDPENVG